MKKRGNERTLYLRLVNAVSLGGDSDTLAAITDSIAEAFYGVPEELKQECRRRLTPELSEILRELENALSESAPKT